MLGYIVKGFLILKREMLIFIPFVFLLALFPTDSSALKYFLFSVALIFSAITYEEKGETNGFLCALPNGRNNIVISKYVFFILVLTVSIVISKIFSVFYYFMNGNEIVINYNFEIIYYTYSIIIISIIFPIIYLIGVNRAKLLLFVSFVITPSFKYLVQIFPNIHNHFFILKSKMYLILIFLFIVYTFSLIVSIWINGKKSY